MQSTELFYKKMLKQRYKETGMFCAHCKTGVTSFVRFHKLIPNGEVRQCFSCGKETLVSTDGRELNKGE